MTIHDSPIVSVRDLRREFAVGRGRNLVAVADVNLDVMEGETLGLVGESGSGKSTLGRMIVGLLPRTSGTIRICGDEIQPSISSSMRLRLSRQIQMIFQDPYTSLNPRMTVGDIIAEGPDAHGLWSRHERRRRIGEWLEKVCLHPSHESRYPHEFSGGQRQRIGIARALALEPKIVVCDEPISALDVSVQAQIVNLLQDLQRDMALTYIFIAHDLSMIRAVCHRMAVMYLGRLVEVGSAEGVYDQPRHPYTQELISANPVSDPRDRARDQRSSTPPIEIRAPINPRPSCLFAPRCPTVEDRCLMQVPPLELKPNPNRHVACLKI